ncbi:MAG: VOC family protein [Halobacteriaceae archaeon]
MGETTGLPADAAVGRVALRVGDLDAVAEFNREVVGLAVVERGADRALLGAGGTGLLELAAAPDAPERRPDQAGLFHTAFRVPSRAALADALARIQSRWELDRASDHRVSEALYLADPEGNGVEVYCDRPREEWPERDGRVAMETLALDLAGLDGGDPDAGAPGGTTVGHVHLEATSLSASREFYEGLGLGVRATYGSGGAFLAAGDYHHHVGLNTWNGRTDPAGGRGLAHFEFVVPGGVPDGLRTREGATAVEGGVEVTDPDGIPVRVRGPDPDGGDGRR